MKYILIIGDGMADNPVPELGGRTPLQTANIPTIDAMAARGTVGHVVTCPKPYPAGSEIAILSIMGCDPRKYFNGRSPMEAAASGIVLLEAGHHATEAPGIFALADALQIWPDAVKYNLRVSKSGTRAYQTTVR